MVDFEGLSDGSTVTSYGGFTWSATGGIQTPRWQVISDSTYHITDGNFLNRPPAFNFPSMNNAVYLTTGNGDGALNGTVVSPTLFNSFSAYFGTWMNSGATSITVTGKLDSTPVGTPQTITLPGVGTMTQYTLNWSSNINTLVFAPSPNNTSTSGHFLMDDFNVTTGPPVPIPGAVWLLGSGLLGLVGIGRKRFRK